MTHNRDGLAQALERRQQLGGARGAEVRHQKEKALGHNFEAGVRKPGVQGRRPIRFFTVTAMVGRNLLDHFQDRIVSIRFQNQNGIKALAKLGNGLFPAGLGGGGLTGTTASSYPLFSNS